MFEAIAVQVLQAAASVEQARVLLKLNWSSVQRIMDRAVERSLFHRQLDDIKLKTSRAWAIREQFRWFWKYRYAGNAEKFFTPWYQWAARCRLEPIRKVAKMLKRRLNNILTWFRRKPGYRPIALTSGP